ncbi:elongator complex protein 3 [Acidaminobacter sp. JC074]|uniref:elongator complex protein 3 n=1 Tax=Acidaminobacter sp. JC074 TaxID=2530199 RepID=UPI001F10C288|nr:radical SAM protein [Acidaminobacter sp. JC074]
MKHFNIPIFVPHEGCPHDCVFCNQKSITGVKESFDIGRVKKTIDDHLESIHKTYDECRVEVAFFGGSFTGIEVSKQEAYLNLTKAYLDAGLIDGVRLSTRPDYIDKTVLDRLDYYGVTTIELGVQSLVEDVLESANRGHDIACVDKACALIKKRKFKLGLQMMIGLPGDTLEKSLVTMEKIISLKPDMVRIYPTIVIENTDLAVLYKKGFYKPLTLDQAVNWCAVLYKHFTHYGIPVIRMGLQASESLSESLAGPYHPSFRQLVESKLYYDVLDGVLKPGRVSVYVHPKEISFLVGQKRDNLNRLEKKYGIKKISVYPKDMDSNEFEVHMNGQVFKVPKMTVK